MFESLFLAVVLVLLANMVLSALAGVAIARRRGVTPWIGALAGGLVPWAGLLVPALMASPEVRLVIPRRRPILLGFVPICVGAGLIFFSQFLDWAELEGSVNTGATTFKESLSGGLGDTIFGVILLTGSCLAVVGVAIALWLRPFLGAAVALMWLATGALSMAILTTVGSFVVDDTSSVAATYTAGHAQATLALAEGVWAAALGAVLLCVGAVNLCQVATFAAPAWLTTDVPTSGGAFVDPPVVPIPPPVFPQATPPNAGWGAPAAPPLSGWGTPPPGTAPAPPPTTPAWPQNPPSAGDGW